MRQYRRPGGRVRQDDILLGVVRAASRLVGIERDGETAIERHVDGLSGAAEVVVGERAGEVAANDLRGRRVAQRVRIPRNCAGARTERQRGRHRRCNEADDKERTDVQASPRMGHLQSRGWWPRSAGSSAGTPPLIADGAGRTLKSAAQLMEIAGRFAWLSGAPSPRWSRQPSRRIGVSLSSSSATAMVAAAAALVVGAAALALRSERR
jgi:hypothetical protein